MTTPVRLSWTGGIVTAGQLLTSTDQSLCTVIDPVTVIPNGSPVSTQPPAPSAAIATSRSPSQRSVRDRSVSVSDQPPLRENESTAPNSVPAELPPSPAALRTISTPGSHGARRPISPSTYRPNEKVSPST